MKQFLTHLLGVALCAAPLAAQHDSGAQAAALLEKAQAAAARGQHQAAAELAQAAVELLAARGKPAEPAVEGLRELALVEARSVETGPARSAEAQEPAAEGPPLLIRQRDARDEGAPALPRTPRGTVLGAPLPHPPAPPALQQDELGLTLKLIHAEVQALRAEVQALRAEMQLMHAQGAAAAPHAPGVGGGGPAGIGQWRRAAPEVRARALLIGPDGVPHEWDLEEDVQLEWSDRECAACDEAEGGVCAECAEGMKQRAQGESRARNDWYGEEPADRGEVRRRMNFQFHTAPAEPHQRDV